MTRRFAGSIKAAEEKIAKERNEMAQTLKESAEQTQKHIHEQNEKKAAEAAWAEAERARQAARLARQVVVAACAARQTAVCAPGADCRHARPVATRGAFAQTALGAEVATRARCALFCGSEVGLITDRPTWAKV